MISRTSDLAGNRLCDDKIEAPTTAATAGIVAAFEVANMDGRGDKPPLAVWPHLWPHFRKVDEQPGRKRFAIVPAVSGPVEA